MDKQTKAYWIGETLCSLPEQFRCEFDGCFDIMDCSKDISVLSDKEHSYFFYYITCDHQEHLKGVITLCKNLDKKLIVVSPKDTAPHLPPKHICAEYYKL
ncbi:AraC family transcriptional regulator, partial [Vibrio alginolyticus]|nr:AraC family transcriptional regulator [Vibrio alginolyticus]